MLNDDGRTRSGPRHRSVLSNRQFFERQMYLCMYARVAEESVAIVAEETASSLRVLVGAVGGPRRANALREAWACGTGRASDLSGLGFRP